MTTLFIDTTYDVTLGLLSDECKWIDIRTFKGQKSSAILQPEIFNLLTNNHLTVKSIKKIVSLAGPGFYTGLRLSEGFCDVFKFFDIPFFSFYSHEIPVLCGVKEGIWMTKAYRGEYFVHSWSKGAQKNEMISTTDLKATLEPFKNVYIHSESAVDDLAKSCMKNSHHTSELLKNDPDKIFHHVFSHKLIRESFYFRPPEDEFKANP